MLAETGQEDTPARLPAAVAANCPAFLGGCPYASNDQVAEWIKAKRAEALDACPAFKDGCPFHEVQDLSSLRKELEKLPASHAHGHGSEGALPAMSRQSTAAETGTSETETAHTALLEMLQVVHRASMAVKETVGGDCPVFLEACPFKNCLTSAGTPLVLELETRSWGLLNLQHHAGDEEVAEDGGPALPPLVNDNEAEGLATKLKEGTKEAHKAAESVHFVREFIRGRVVREVYAQMVVNLYHVYKALEEGLDRHADHPLVESLYFPDELCRTASLKQDAEYFCGADWEVQRQPSQVTSEYVKRLHQIAEDSPELLVPHAYTRYLGDLSGGQVLRRAAIRGLKLPDDGSGVCFYSFRRIPDAKVFKNMYRARMDSLPADRATADRMVVEANHAFYLNTRIFQELDALAGFTADTTSLAAPVPPAPPAAAGLQAAAGCPFAALAASGMAMPTDHPPVPALSSSAERKGQRAAVKAAAPANSAAAPQAAVLAAVLALLLAVVLPQLLTAPFADSGL